ncbi:hypothetical protein DUNSADRAFT_2472 [Dunaliella salina]|uniref:Uncharacterized protein n=1 Tax=Dunaliella salina TaxID=3046 RepID=A0ABQ7GVL3_DUNSA|nr:hypothetical protein DUNSADRAFT_2472 [Dunaliella salina]|eukprot:KAF5838637.1 hypothetical protein DUNSADRAFT_2472 [Dunaliella salina]
MDGLAAELELLSQNEEQGPLLAAELICKVAEEALESLDEESHGSDQATSLPEELLESLLDSFGAWVPLGDEEPSPQLLLLGAIILDVCPLLMRMGHSGSRVAGLMLPALLRAAAQVANPREMLAALMEALDVHARNCFHGSQYLLMLSLLPLLPSLLAKLSRRKLACALEALGPVEALAAEAGQHLWQAGHPLHAAAHAQWRTSPPGQATRAHPAPHSLMPPGSLHLQAPLKSGAHTQVPSESDMRMPTPAGDRMDPLKEAGMCAQGEDGEVKGAQNERGGGGLDQRMANVTEKVVVQPFVVMLEGVWRGVLLPEVQQCCMSAGPAASSCAEAAWQTKEAASVQASTPSGQAVHACRVFATSCLRTIWLLAGCMPPPPTHPSNSTLAASRDDGSKGVSTLAADWPWPRGGVWEGPLGQLAQLSLTAVHAAAAVVTGECPNALLHAGGPASGNGGELAGGDWEAVGWEQVLSAVHAVHPEADTWQQERVKTGSEGKSAGTGSSMGVCGKGRTEAQLLSEQPPTTGGASSSGSSTVEQPQTPGGRGEMAAGESCRGGRENAGEPCSIAAGASWCWFGGTAVTALHVARLVPRMPSPRQATPPSLQRPPAAAPAAFSTPAAACLSGGEDKSARATGVSHETC